MDNAQLVSEFDRRYDLMENRHCKIWIESSFSLQNRSQAFTCDKLHHQIDILIDAYEPKNSCDVGMIQEG